VDRPETPSVKLQKLPLPNPESSFKISLLPEYLMLCGVWIKRQPDVCDSYPGDLTLQITRVGWCGFITRVSGIEILPNGQRTWGMTVPQKIELNTYLICPAGRQNSCQRLWTRISKNEINRQDLKFWEIQNFSSKNKGSL